MKTLIHSILLLSLCLTTACGGGGAEADAGASASSEVPAHYWLASAPASARDVGAARAELTGGDTVAMRGVIGGSVKPFVEGLAAFMLIDPALKSCVGDGMGCETPWDYCCVDPQTVAENTVTVEFREDGSTLDTSLHGVNGLDHLKTVVVEGVAEQDAQGNVTIVATGVAMLD